MASPSAWSPRTARSACPRTAGTTHLYKDPESLALGAPALARTYENQTLNWRSTDNGKTWKYIGLAGTGAGPHSLTSSGFSDPDYAIDAGGRIYNTEINLANVAVFSSGDDGQTYSRGNPEVTSGDRPWLTAGRKDEAYLYVNTCQQIFRTADGGLTWALQSVGNAAGPDAKMFIDPKNPDGLIGPHNPQGMTISHDQGKTWKAYDGAGLGKTVDFFGAVAVDKAGNVYRAAAGGYGGPRDTKAGDGEVTFNAFDRKKMAWGTAVTLPAPAGDMLWPWVVAGDDGKVAVAWLQRTAKRADEFVMMVGATENAHGTTVTCKNGQKLFVPARWTVVNASGTPVHQGRDLPVRHDVQRQRRLPGGRPAPRRLLHDQLRQGRQAVRRGGRHHPRAQRERAEPDQPAHLHRDHQEPGDGQADEGPGHPPVVRPQPPLLTR